MPTPHRLLFVALLAMACRSADEHATVVDAQRNASDIVSVVGDFDPFLNAQDPCPRYAALAVVPRGTGWQVTVTAQCEGGVATPAVPADVVREGTGWRFANFRLPERPTYDLVSQLGAAQAMRDSARRPRDTTDAAFVRLRGRPTRATPSSA